MTNTTTTTTKRITKAMRYADIKALLSGETVHNGTSIEDALKFIDNEVALLAKKNTSDKKPTKTQEENEAHKARIIEFLSGQTEGVTCTDVQKSIPEFADFNNQKVAALMRQLVNDGKAVKAMVKGKAMFSLA